ncbi:competence protein CoiA [Bacillus fonticola]|uniref:competence protein CoiA n=1 Tax=Bacillus fonticola TaxID=2728853 RepID=UPI001473CED5|nr:competence protein CoiA family protein [Bacillus fonticola]
MFVAETKTGRAIWLDPAIPRDEVKKWRKREAFRCPACQQDVILKIGSETLPHFAHKQREACVSFSEGETAVHLSGKALLFEVLTGWQHTEVKIEAMLPNLTQRPDLLVTTANKRYAIEFQHSPLSSEAYQQRTNGYVAAGYTPVWIVSQAAVNRVKPSTFRFQRLAKFSSLHRNLRLLHTNERILYTFPFLYPYAPHTTIAITNAFPLSKNTHRPSLTTSIQEAILSWRLLVSTWTLRPLPKRLTTYYLQLGITYPSFPLEVGIPVVNVSLSLPAAPHWQSVVWLGLRSALPFAQIVRELQHVFPGVVCDKAWESAIGKYKEVLQMCGLTRFYTQRPFLTKAELTKAYTQFYTQFGNQFFRHSKK